MFKFSVRSLRNLEGVNRKLVNVVHEALAVSDIDFAVIQGLRTMEEQKRLVASGASQTMKSKHLSGDAVDLMAFLGRRGSWELPLYFKLVDAMKNAAIANDVRIRWGGAWSVKDICTFKGTGEDMYKSYIDYKRSTGGSPFVDSPHFEIASEE